MFIIRLVAQEFTVRLSQRFQLNRKPAGTIAQCVQACERFDHFLIPIEEARSVSSKVWRRRFNLIIDKR